MAIGASAYKLVVDATKFAEGTALSRKELSFLKQTLRETATDADHYAAGLDHLNELQRKGALTTDQYEKALEKLREETTAIAAPDVPWFNKVIPTIDVINAGKLAFDTLRSSVRMVKDEMADQLDQIDSIVASSEKLGITAASFQIITQAASLANIEVSSVDRSIEKMLVAISKGDTKKFADVFGMIGLSAKDLRAARPDEAFARILSSIEGIASQADKVRVATAIFGDADVIRMSAAGIGEAADAMKRFGGLLDDVDVEHWNQFEKSSNAFAAGFDSAAKRLTLEALPAMREMFGLIDDITGGENSLESTFRNAGNAATGFLITLRDIQRHFDQMNPQAGPESGKRKTLTGKTERADSMFEWLLRQTMPSGIAEQFRGFADRGADSRRGEELDILLKKINQKNLQSTTGTSGGGEVDNEALRETAKNTRELKIEVTEHKL